MFRRLSRSFVFGVAFLFAYSVIYYQFPTCHFADLGDYFFTQDIDEKASRSLSHDVLPLAGIFVPDPFLYFHFLSIPADTCPLSILLALRLGCRSPPSSQV